VTGLLLLAALAWGGQWAWLRAQPGGVPVDWAGSWSGDYASGLGGRHAPRRAGAQVVRVDGDAAYQSDGRPGLDEFMDLGSWQVGPVWTLAGWFRLESFPAGEAAWASLAGGMRDNDWMLGVLGRRPAVTLGPDGGKFRLPAAGPFELKRWTHLAAVGNPGHLRLFVDGQLAAEHRFPPDSPLARPPGGQLHFIGAGGGELPFRRQVDDYAVYARNLSAREIAELHGAGRGGALRAVQRSAPENAARRERLQWVAALLAVLWLVPRLVGWAGRVLLPGPGHRVRAFAAVWTVLGVGTVLTLLATPATAVWVTVNAGHQFAAESQRIQQEVDGHFVRLLLALQLVRANVFSQPQPSLEDWNRSLAAVNLGVDFPAVQLTGFAELVWPEDRAAHETRWRRLYGDSYRIKPVLPVPERNAQLGELTNAALPLVFGRFGPDSAGLEPTPGNYLGQDLLAVPGNGPTNDVIAAMVSAAALGSLPWSVPPPALALRDHPETSVVGLPILLPVQWRDPSPPRDSRRGVLVCVVNFDRLFAEAYGQQAPDSGLRITFGQDPKEVVFPLFDSQKLWRQTAKPDHPWFHFRPEAKLYQGRFFCEVWTTPEFDRHHHRRAPWLVTLAGGAFTLLLAGFVAGQVRARLTETAVAENLRRLNAELAAATKERARLSRDLHDGTIQNLYAVGLELGQARALIKADPPRAEAELGHTLTTLQAAITELRQFVLELEPEAWQGQTVRNALDSLLARLRRTTALEFHLSISPVADALPAKTAIHVLQLVREGLSNVLRHADARNVWVELGRSGRREEAHDLLGTQVAGTVMGSQSLLTSAPIGGEGAWTLEIRDDGRGFDVPTKAGNGGRGLRNFLERAAELGGRCEVRSAAGTGSRIMVTFPQPPGS
jgi:signal transduction histidine kinase